MKPIIVIPPDLIDEKNLAMLRDNDICVIVAADPAKLRFLDPIPAVAGRTAVEHAAIQLSRKILSTDYHFSRAETCKLYVELLVKGTPLDPHPSQAELEEKTYDTTRLEEIRDLAREDARIEAAAKKAAKLASKKENANG